MAGKLQELFLPRYPSKDESAEKIRWMEQLRNGLPKIASYNVTVDLASVSATSYLEQSVTVTGATTSDGIIVIPPSLTSGLYFISGRVSAADTVKVVVYNSTGSPIDEASATWAFITIRK